MILEVKYLPDIKKIIYGYNNLDTQIRKKNMRRTKRVKINCLLELWKIQEDVYDLEQFDDDVGEMYKIYQDYYQTSQYSTRVTTTNRAKKKTYFSQDVSQSHFQMYNMDDQSIYLQ